MSWIEIVLIVVVLGAIVVAVRRYNRPVLQVVYATAKLPCHKPRYREGVAKLMPAYLAEQKQFVRCTLWRLHDGPHEGASEDGKVERWEND